VGVGGGVGDKSWAKAAAYFKQKKKTFFGQFARSDKERVDFVVRIEFWRECEVFMW
jgi:hypothetical protein